MKNEKTTYCAETVGWGDPCERKVTEGVDATAYGSLVCSDCWNEKYAGRLPRRRYVKLKNDPFSM
tara:strand:- start:702 stop:896 length:195 start_codon:yes stop_codon:yes gene_type:complete